MTRHRPWVGLAVAVGIVCLVGAAPVVGVVAAGQSSPTQPTPSTETPSQPTAGNGSVGNRTLANGSDAPNGWGPFKSGDEYAADFAEGMVNWTVAQVEVGIKGLVSTFNRFFFGLPAPGDPDDPMSWQSPENGWWPAVWGTYLALAPVGLWLVGIGYIRLADAPQERRREQLRQAMHALLAILFGFLIAPLGLHLGNAISLGLAPSGTEFMSTPGNTAKLGLGLLFGVILIAVKSVVVLIGILILILQWFVVHIIVAFWPLFWGFRATPFDGLRAIGHAGVAAWIILIVLKIFQSGILRLMFNVEWAPGSDPAGTILALAGTAVGLFFTTILAPKVALSKMVPAAVLMMGTKQAGVAAENVPSGRDVYHRSRERYRERFGGAAGGPGGASASDGGGSGGGTSGRTIGSVQTRKASYGRPGGKPGAETRSAQRRQEQTKRTGYTETHGYD